MSKKPDKGYTANDKDRFKMKELKTTERDKKKSSKSLTSPRYAAPKHLDGSNMIRRLNDSLAARQPSDVAEESKLKEQLKATEMKNASLQKKIEEMEIENANLSRQIEDMKVEADKRVEKTKTEALERMARQAEKLRKEFGKIQSSTLHRIPVPAYKLRLLTDFALNYSGCQIMLLEQEGEALLFGQDDECNEARTTLLTLVKVRRRYMYFHYFKCHF
jgi:uncharacterized protein with von Willebrand factor type A (vWA) domain